MKYQIQELEAFSVVGQEVELTNFLTRIRCKSGAYFSLKGSCYYCLWFGLSDCERYTNLLE